MVLEALLILFVNSIVRFADLDAFRPLSMFCVNVVGSILVK